MKFKQLNEGLYTYNQTEGINLEDDYNMVIIGEIHDKGMIPVYKDLIQQFRPEYFICEFADRDICLTRAELKDRMDNVTNGSTDINDKCDYQYNYWCYDLAYQYNLKLIGCNPVLQNPKFSNMDEEDKYREWFMFRVIQRYYNRGKCLVQLGDHHLRSIPISTEYLKFCGDTVDGRGIYNSPAQLVVHNSSPIYEYFKNMNDVAIYRVAENFDSELDFLRRNDRI